MKKEKMLFTIIFSILLISLISGNYIKNTFAMSLKNAEEASVITQNSFDTPWEWSLTQVVSTDLSGYSGYPSQAIDSLENIHAVWYDKTDYLGSGTDYDIFYRQWNATLRAWNPITVLSPGSNFSTYPSIAIDSQDNIYCVWEDATDYDTTGDPADGSDIVYRMWNSTTESWTSVAVVNAWSNLRSEKAKVAVDAFGNIHVVYVESEEPTLPGGDNSIFHTYFDKDTQSWTTPEDITPGLADSFVPSIALDSSNKLHAVWHDYTDAMGSGTDRDIFYRMWTPVTESWQPMAVVSTESTGGSYDPSIAIDSLDNVHVCWSDQTDLDDSGSDYDIFYKRKDKITDSWITTEVVSHGCYSNSLYPTITADSLGYIHIAWEDWTKIPGYVASYNIFYKKWHLTTKTNTEVEVISSESSGLGASKAKLSTDGADNIHAFWSDLSDYNSSGSDRDIFYKRYSPILSPPVLATINPNPSDDGIITLDWNLVEGASFYIIYRSTSFIWSSEDATALIGLTGNIYVDHLPTQGDYYYVIIATDGVTYSAVSNCEHVLYDVPALSEFVVATSLILGVTIIVLIMSRVWKKKRKQD